MPAPRPLALALLLLGCLVACGEAEDPRPDLILISIGGLRADRVGAYGETRATSPGLDALAARGALFERVVAESSGTLPSHVTLLTGLHPATHGVQDPARALGPQTRTLAELLRAAGYHTVGLTGGGRVGRRNGLDRGFDVFNDVRRGLPRLLRQAGRYLSEADGQPVFLFLYAVDLGCPYAPSDAYEGRFASPGAEEVDVVGRCDSDFNELGLTPGQARFLSDRYDESIRELDDTLGGFLAEVEDAVVLVTSDHGLAFLEHGEIGSERSLHGEVLRVPLVIAAPDLAPARIGAAAGLVDVAPTLLELAGAAIPEDLEGRSLVPLLGGGESPDGDAPRFSELAGPPALQSVMTRDHHLIVDAATGEARLFDLESDPGESRDVASEQPRELESLRAALERFHAGRTPRPTERVGGLSEGLRNQLREFQEEGGR